MATSSNNTEISSKVNHRERVLYEYQRYPFR